MFAYDSPEYVKDMGTPERYEAVCKDFENGTVKAKSLRNKQKAIFIDRDGTINRYIGFLRKPSELELLPGVIEAIRKINNSGYLAIVITNQPVIARGEVTVNQLQQIHNKMETILGDGGAYLDAIYYCPHHPDKGFEGEIPELKVQCNCRKPRPGMLLQAADEATSPDSDPEKASLMFICKRPRLNYGKLSGEDKAALKRLAGKSDLLKNPIPQRGRK